MKPRVAITIDVEAQPARAVQDHIDRLVWGKTEDGYFGLGAMMDMADRHHARLTCFLDYTEKALYGDELIDVGREILRHGHDLGLHCHADLFPPSFWQERGLEEEADMCQASQDQCRAMLDYVINAHRSLVSGQPLSYRSGGYRLSATMLNCLAEMGIALDASHNPYSEHNVLGGALLAPFRWSNGLYEVPVTCIQSVKGTGIVWNFNAGVFINGDVNKCKANHARFLRSYFKRFGTDAIATLVMHSWSFFKRDDKGHFAIPIPDAAEKFNSLLAMMQEDYEIVCLGDIARQMQAEEQTKAGKTVTVIEIGGNTDVCPICRAPVVTFVGYNCDTPRKCPYCHSLERQRVFYELYHGNAFGEKILEGKKILHLSPSRSEKIILSRLDCEVLTLDIRQTLGVDLVADIQNMPEIATESQDVILASFVFTCTENFLAALDELFRILKPGGILLCHDPLHGEATIEMESMEDITKYYGLESYQKYHIGSFRAFGEKDYLAALSARFEATIHYGTDKATGESVAWVKAVKPVLEVQ